VNVRDMANTIGELTNFLRHVPISGRQIKRPHDAPGAALSTRRRRLRLGDGVRPAGLEVVSSRIHSALADQSSLW
jgi:hypothetical protein